MQTTTQDPAAVGRQAAEGLTRIMLESRLALPHAANGHPIAPSNARAAEQRRAIAAGKCDPIGIITNILLCDVADGVSAEDALAPLRGIEALVRLRAAQRAKAERPVPALIRAETRAEYDANTVTHLLLERPDCPEVAKRAAVAFGRHIAALAILRDTCLQRAFAARGTH